MHNVKVTEHGLQEMSSEAVDRDRVTYDRIAAGHFGLGDTTSHSQAPSYYEVLPGHDLYDAFLTHFGIEVTLQHMEMEAMQYLWRCRGKGEYDSDIVKVKVIIDRIMKIKGIK